MNKEELKEGIIDYPEKDWITKQSALDLIDQLDEPETLTEEWLYENREMYLVNDSSENAVPVKKLEKLIVHKMDKQEKVVVPQFVGDDYESSDIWGKDEFRDTNWVLRTAYSPNVDTKKPEILTWIRNNPAAYVNMVQAIENGNGYTVEEKKYYVMDSEDIPLLERANSQIYKTTTDLSIHEAGRDNSRFGLTEQEIKDYDKRFWAFAEPVKEVEFRLSF